MPHLPAATSVAPASEEMLVRIEALAAALAADAGAFATARLEDAILVDYKTNAAGKEVTTDPVSEVDRAVEALIRERVTAEFPAHLVVGEEVEEHPSPDAEYLWVIDPIDGTANFVNGFPLFAVSIGVLHRGRPIAGAVWCAATHALGPGVYHAHEGGPLRLDGRDVRSERATQVKRALAAAPGGSSAGTAQWDHRVTGSMAIEAAFVAAGVFTSAPFWGPKIWDVAGGIVLIRAAGREVWLRGSAGWQPFERFEAPAELPIRSRQAGEQRTPSLRDWRGSIIVGTTEGARALRERAPRPPWWRRIWGSHS